MGKELHEEEHDSPLVSEAVNLTTPQKWGSCALQLESRSTPAEMPEPLSVLQMGLLKATVFPQQGEWESPEMFCIK